MSATYRQASTTREDITAKDPLNKYLARQSRLRLDAEIIRDVALTASGLLSHKVGGPSVYPPGPPRFSRSRRTKNRGPKARAKTDSVAACTPTSGGKVSTTC